MSYSDFENLVFVKGAGETGSDLEDGHEVDFFVTLKLAKEGQVLTMRKAFRVAFLRFENPADRVDVDLEEDYLSRPLSGHFSSASFWR